MTKDSSGNKAKALNNFYEYMEDAIIKLFSESCPKVREVGFTGYPIFGDTGIGSIGLAVLEMMEPINKFLSSFKALDKAKELQKEQRTWVKGVSPFLRIGMGNQTSNEGPIDERGNQP